MNGEREYLIDSGDLERIRCVKCREDHGVFYINRNTGEYWCESCASFEEIEDRDARPKTYNDVLNECNR